MRFLVLSNTAGNGHNAMGNAVIEQMKKDGHETKIIDYLKPTKIRSKISHEWYFWFLSHFPKFSAKIYQDLLNRDIEKKPNFALKFMTNSKKANKQILDVINEFKPDVIYCTHVYTAYKISELKKEGKLKKVLTFFIVSDYEIIPYMEFTTHIDYILTPTKDVHNKLYEMGFKEEQLLPIGITVSTKFSTHLDTKENTKKSLGLNENLPTFLLMNGGIGFGNTLKLLKEINKIDNKNFQLIIVNGKNEKMKKKIDAFLLKNPNLKCLNLGYSQNVDILMDASDLLIGKIGGVAVAEAFNKELPILVAGNAPFQEWSNVIYLGEKQAILYGKDEKETKAHLESLISDPLKLEQLKKNVKGISMPNATIDFTNFIYSLLEKEGN
jgi:processive 1,2-diacylglycerol beta-glucosyltransferase